MNVMRAAPTHKLYTPGPVEIPLRVSLAGAYVSYHHRTPAFSSILLPMLQQMQALFGTQAAVLPVHTTGRGALEGAYANLFSAASDHVLVVTNGNFGDMAASTLRKMGMPLSTYLDDWTKDVDVQELEQLLVSSGATGLVVVHNDTSNAMVNPISDICALAQRHGVLTIVDAVSSIGAMPFYMDRWGVDVVVTSSQKGLMSPPGLAFAVLGPRAWQKAEAEAGQTTGSYINFQAIAKSLEKGETPGTTPVSLVLSVAEAVQMIHEEGLEACYTRHGALAAATRAAFTALGFPAFPLQARHRSEALSCYGLLPNMESEVLVEHLAAKYGLLISSGLGAYAKSTLRISNMGALTISDMLLLVTALEASLRELGFPVTMGTGTTAFMDAYAR